MNRSIKASLILGLIASSCAPVSSSVPKLSNQTPRTVDSLAEPRGALGVRQSSVKVLPSDQYSAEETKASRKYTILKLNEDQLNAFLAKREVNENIAAGSSAVDVLVLVELGVKADDFESKAVEKFELEITRDAERGEKFRVAVSGRTSKEAWAYLKKNAVSISIAYRDETK